MFLTNFLLKKAKSRYVMVLMESAVSGHHQTRIRERLADKLEFLAFDPFIQEESLYKEKKKIRSMKSTWSPKTYSPRVRVSNFFERTN